MSFNNVKLFWLFFWYVYWVCIKGIYIYICTYVYIHVCIYLPTPPHEQDVTQGQFFKCCLTGLNLVFLLDWLPYILKICIYICVCVCVCTYKCVYI